MKKAIFTLTLVFGSIAMMAQTLAPRNVVKTNLLGLSVSVINVNYEYKLTEQFSVGLVAGYAIPKTRTLSASGSTADNGDLSYTGEITPEGTMVNPYFRWYTNGAVTGFYLEAFARYYDYSFEIPYNYEKNGSDILAYADGSASAFGGGLGLGTQIPLGANFVLDLYLGGGLGMGNAHAETNDENLDEQDFADIKAEMDGLSDVNIQVIGAIVDNMTYDANTTSAWADIENYPIPMIRAGVSFGYMF